MLLNNQWFNEKIKKEMKNYLETNDNEHTTTQNLWDAAKAGLKGKFIAIQAFLKREEKSQIDNLTYHLKEWDKEEKAKPKVSRRKEIIKIREEINKIEIQKTIQKKSTKPRAGFWKGKQNWQTSGQTHQEERKNTNTKLEVKKEKCQWILQKYKKP